MVVVFVLVSARGLTFFQFPPISARKTQRIDLIISFWRVFRCIVHVVHVAVFDKFTMVSWQSALLRSSGFKGHRKTPECHVIVRDGFGQEWLVDSLVGLS